MSKKFAQSEVFNNVSHMKEDMTLKAYAHEIIDTLTGFSRDMFLGWNRKMLREIWTEGICPFAVMFLIFGVWLFAMACPFVVIVQCSIGGRFSIALGFLCFALVAVLSLPIINRLICWWYRKFLP